MHANLPAVPAEVEAGKSTLAAPLTVETAPSPDGPPPPPLPPDESVTHRCANCLTPLAGPFCAQCGQHVADYHRSVWRFVADFFDNVFCWDNKLLRTLGPLLKQPGFLTQEFMVGRRVRYVHPLRLFLFTSAICLTLLQYNHGYGKARGHTSPPKPGVSFHLDGDDDEDEDGDKKPTASPLPPASVSPAPAAPPNAAVSPTTPAAPTASPTASQSPTRDGGNNESTESLGQILRDTMRTTVKDGKAKDPKAEEDLAKRWETLGKNVQKGTDAARNLKQDVTTDIQRKASWVSLAMLPIFAWLMRFTYGRRGGFFFAYLVFSLHYHTFLLLFWTVFTWLMTLLQAAHLFWLAAPFLIGFLVPPWYLYLSLKRFYGESRIRTAAKTFAIGGLHLLAIIIGVAIAGVGSSLTIR